MRVAFCCVFCGLVLSVWPAAVRVAPAQEAPPADAAAVDLPEIADEPKTIDPAALMPAKLTARATVDLSDVSLSEVVAWLRDEQELVVLLNRSALADAGVLPTEPVSDRLDDESIYLLLERLRALNVGLLETYRTALRASKPRERDVLDPKEIVTVYYRMHAHVADDLAELLRTLVAPDSWQRDAQPDAPGQIIRVASSPELAAVDGGLKGDGSVENAHTLVMARAVLIITQTRETHDDVAEVIRRVESGDPPAGMEGIHGFGGFGGMGGFGGGFYSVPPAQD